MNDLIEALTILRKYGNPYYPTQCEHDVLNVNIDPNEVSKEDRILLEEFGFFAKEKEDDLGPPRFVSYRFGNA